MSNIMLDLETLGTEPGCAIISVGACVFSPEGIGETFYQVVDIEKNVGSMSPSTIKWWMQQSEEARAVFKVQGEHIAGVLGNFTTWWKINEGEFLWGHGASFDAPILEAAYKALNYPAPFKFWNTRCTRTIYSLAAVVPNRFVGTHHNALDDAKAQAEAVIRAWKNLGITEA